ncbi:MAG: F0F1 ATP synthase subunit delta [Gammaproteobacteria bacterium]|nr:MAG: F0F1 ATP synthase subunit delta [Gammaproteobacteria bacterium]
MAEKSTIARPYAQAAFDIAQEKGDLKGWSEMLQLIAAVSSDAVMSDMISNPSIEREKITEIIVDVCGDSLNDTAKNFVQVLAENGRLNVAVEIAQGYEAHRAEAEKTVEAEVTSAFPLTDTQIKSVTDALKKRLGREVNLVTKIDESIVGGAIIRAGDLVIDGSVNGQLEKLANTLMG